MKAKGQNREMANEESLDPAILIFAFWYPFSHGGRQALLLAWGFGRYAPEASVGMSRDSEKARRLRYQRREALAPRPVHEETSAL